MTAKDAKLPPQKLAGATPRGATRLDGYERTSALLAIGATEGGLEPIGQLLSALPGNIGLSVVLTQTSQLEIEALLGFLTGCTTMPAQAAVLKPSELWTLALILRLPRRLKPSSRPK